MVDAAISRELGRLTEAVENMRQDFSDLKDAVAKVPKLHSDMETIRPKVEAHERLVNRAWGILAGAGVGGGALGATFKALIDRVSGGTGHS